jgi:hypothetical protein
MKSMKKWCLLIILGVNYPQLMAQIAIKRDLPGIIKFTKEELKDKIKGGWAGQTIGVTFGGPYEFRYEGSFIQDYQPLLWYDGYLKNTMLNNPGLYDDLYMDLSFVDVFEKNGPNAPVDSFASAFANAGYMLWHANQAARYNILNGIKAPASGFWMNNPHADDIDFQIESDFAGLMCPGMPILASSIADKVGHIMNFGDGWYGGVFISTMYTLTFVSNDIGNIVTEALTSIPAKSTFHQCIADVIRWHQQFPNDWHRTWFELQKKWSSDIGCPDGVFTPFDIDSKINSAYVAMALLYGNGDYTKTLTIAARAGQDADCNPSSVGGVLGAMLGYKNIPAYWKQGLKEAEDIPFKYTDMSLNKVYEIGFKQALQNIQGNGGSITGDNISVKREVPKTVRFEQSFPGIYPSVKIELPANNSNTINFDFTGSGFVLRGESKKKSDSLPEYIFNAVLYIDNEKMETAKLPTSFTTRRHELFWKYALPDRQHQVRMEILNPDPNYSIRAWDYIVYRNK